jgi:hypothetical protein
MPTRPRDDPDFSWRISGFEKLESDSLAVTLNPESSGE